MGCAWGPETAKNFEMFGRVEAVWGYFQSQREKSFREGGALSLGVSRGWLALRNGLACMLASQA